MYIKAILKESKQSVYLNTDKYDRFVVCKDEVEAIGIDNLSLYLEKTKELNEELNSLLPLKTTKGFEKFE